MNTIALLIRPDTHYGREVIRGVGRFAQDQPWAVHVLPPTVAALASLQRSRPDGVISHVPEEALRAVGVRYPGVPTVDVSQTPAAGLAAVMPDNRRIGELAAGHLLERGLRRFGFVASRDVPVLDQRYEGFAQIVRSAGFACARHLSKPYADAAWRDQADEDRRVVRWLALLGAPVGILAGSDETAAQVLRACRDGGLAVPEQVCVVGVHDDPMVTALARPALSSVRTGCERVGWEAARVLAGLLAGRRPPRRPVLIAPIEVAARGSSDLLAVDDPVVRDALAVIKARASGPFDVNLLAQELRLSRRTVERRFLAGIGRTPADEIRLVRVERAKGLLRDTDLPVAEVARRSGYASSTRLGEAMRLRLGVAPTAYRRQTKN